MKNSSDARQKGNPHPLVNRVGHWLLVFDPGGTLIRLSFRDGPSLLHWSDYEFSLGDGRIFYPRGWDECFPTIEAHGESGVMGRLVGHAPQVQVTSEGVSQEWVYPGTTAKRTFSPAEDGILAGFEAQNTGVHPLEYLWASHALFTVRGLLRVRVARDRGLDDFTRDSSCTKFFVPASGPLILEREESIVTLSTDQPFWGIWLNRGGWPKDAPAGFCCIGIEATNCDAEIPKGALLQPDEVFRGCVSLKIESERL